MFNFKFPILISLSVLSCENNGGCSDICIPTPNGPQCACPAGYELMRDGKVCQGKKEKICDNNNLYWSKNTLTGHKQNYNITLSKIAI